MTPLRSNPAVNCAGSGYSENAVTTYAYNTDQLGNVSSTTDPRGYTTAFAYDTTKTFLTETTNHLGHKTTKTYNPGTGKEWGHGVKSLFLTLTNIYRWEGYERHRKN